MLYDVIERQRLEAGILERIEALVARCPLELRGYLCVPLLRQARRGHRVLQVTLVTTSSGGWFISAAGLYPQHDARWLTKLDMQGLRACARFLDSGKDIPAGLSIDAALHKATTLKQDCEAMRW